MPAVYKDGRKRDGAIEILEAWDFNIYQLTNTSDAELFEWVEAMGYAWDGSSWIPE